MAEIELNDHSISKGNITVSYFLGAEEKELTFDYDLLIEHVSDEGLNFGIRMVGRDEDGNREPEDAFIDPTIWTDENTNEALESYLNKLHKTN